MSDENKVISLDQRRKARDESQSEAAGTGETEAIPGDQGKPLPGTLVWLHCPTCETYQYTEVVMAGGREHNVCGTQVEEVAVEIDVRAEVTIAEFNLTRLNDLLRVLEAERANFEEYRKRLQLVAGRAVPGYVLDEAVLAGLPVAEISPLGLMVPKALANPAARFTPAPDTDNDPTGAPVGDDDN